MSTTSPSPIQLLRTQLSKRLDQEFVPFLLTKAVDHHCRKGTRDDCPCAYCAHKRKLTYQLGSGFKPQHWKLPVQNWYLSMEDRYHFQKFYLERDRHSARIQARWELEEIKQHVLQGNDMTEDNKTTVEVAMTPEQLKKLAEKKLTQADVEGDASAPAKPTAG